MRILYCVPALYNPGGMERILTEKVNALAHSEGFEIFIFTTDQNDKEPYFEIDQRVAITHSKLNFNDYFSASFLVKLLQTKKLLKTYKIQLENFIAKNNIDVVVSLGGKELEFLYKLKSNCVKICELHFSIDIREQFILSRGQSLVHKMIAKYRTHQIVKQTKNLDKFVVLTKADEAKLKNTHKNLAQIYNFSPLNPCLRAPLINKKIIAVGKLDPQKGFDLLIKASSYVKNWEGWIIEIYGQGPDLEKLNSLINNYGLQNTVFLKGVSNNVGKIYETASVFVLSSRYEGFPMVLLEAISYGLPIVSFDCVTGPNEIIKDDDCGILVEDGNVQKMAEALQDIISNPHKRGLKSQVAFGKSKTFSKENIMQEWKDLFNTLVQSKR